jgi:hypothetical protein
VPFTRQHEPTLTEAAALSGIESESRVKSESFTTSTTRLGHTTGGTPVLWIGGSYACIYGE